MNRLFLLLTLAVALPAAAQVMAPNKEPVPSPSDLRSAAGEDRPQGQAREARTPSPSDLAVERPRIDGDRPTSAMLAPAAGGGSAAGQPSLENHRGEPIRTR
jgi:hypothetical protein